MNIDINDKNAERIAEKVRSGRFPCADEVIEAALWLLDEHDRASEAEYSEAELAEIHARVHLARQQLDRGEGIPAEKVLGDLHHTIRAVESNEE